MHVIIRNLYVIVFAIKHSTV